MRIVQERIVLRRGRRKDEKMPHRIKLEAMEHGVSLLVEVVNKASDSVGYYLFAPEILSGRRSIAFRESGTMIYWLAGLNPRNLLQGQAEALLAQSDVRPEKDRITSTTGQSQSDRNVLVFGIHDSLVAVYRTLDDVAAAMNLRSGAIDKLCRTKRPSTETGYSFRYRKKKLDLGLTDFTLTLSRYDELCKRRSRSED